MPSTPDPSPSRITIVNRPVRGQAVFLTLVLLILISLPVILSGNRSGRGAADDYHYHWIAIQRFAQQWPVPDLGDYPSATTPGYHLLLAPIVRDGLTHAGAQIVALGWSLAFLGLLCSSASKTLGRMALVMMLPLLASMYVLYPAIWLLPDNAGWFFVLSIILLALRDRSLDGSWVLSGVLLVALIWVRQVHIWVAGVIWLTAWLGTSESTPDSLASFFRDPLRRSGRTIIAIACTVPGFLTLVWFVGIWGGLVPPSFQGQHQGPNPATPGFILLQLAILSVFFAPVLWARVRTLWAHHWRWLLLACIIGLVLGLVPSSSYSLEAGRYSGWWNFIKLVPTLADRSPVFVLGSVVGAAALCAWLSMAPRRDMWIWLGVLLAFTLAQSANHASWQRYHEPMLLVMLVLIVARAGLSEQMRLRAAIGALALAMLLGGLTAMSMLRAEPVSEVSLGANVAGMIENGAHLPILSEDCRSS